MQHLSKTEKRIMIGVFVIGVIILLSSILVIYKYRSDRSQCTQQLTATISNIKQYNTDAEDIPSYGIYLNYNYNNAMYQDTRFVNYTRNNIGDQVNIFIDPNDPEHVYYGSFPVSKFVEIIMAGLIWIGTAAYVLHNDEKTEVKIRR